MPPAIASSSPIHPRTRRSVRRGVAAQRLRNGTESSPVAFLDASMSCHRRGARAWPPRWWLRSPTGRARPAARAPRTRCSRTRSAMWCTARSASRRPSAWSSSKAACMIRIVRLGSPRRRGEGLRIGAARRPPRGVKKKDYARLDYYDVWLPELAPSQKVVSWALSQPFRQALGVRARLPPRDGEAGSRAAARAARAAVASCRFLARLLLRGRAALPSLDPEEAAGQAWRTHLLTPVAWVMRWAPLIARGPVLDVASGPGRHAKLLAARGLDVVAVDREPHAIPGVKFVSGPGGRQPVAVRRPALRRDRGHELSAPAAFRPPRRGARRGGV